MREKRVLTPEEIAAKKAIRRERDRRHRKKLHMRRMEKLAKVNRQKVEKEIKREMENDHPAQLSAAARLKNEMPATLGKLSDKNIGLLLCLLTEEINNRNVKHRIANGTMAIN